MDGGILRLLDANGNRAREALRVLEDVARFVLDDPRLQSALKGLRHDLTASISAYLPAALTYRDTAGDVGTTVTTSGEGRRDDLAHVATAAAKRLGESLRAIEESLKTLDSAAAERVEAIRYAFYDVERELLLSLRPRGRMHDVRLCVLVTESLCRIPWLDAAAAAIDGGADCLQLREKNLEGGELLKRAEAMVALCRGHGVVSIINDRPDVAVLSGADGVHVGQGDLPALSARRIVGHDRIVGVSTHSPEMAQAARRDGADYIGIGPVFRSSTKPRDFVVTPEQLAHVLAVGLPTMAIAGIDESNLAGLIGQNVRAIAVSSAALACDDVRAATRKLRELLDAAP